MSKSLRKWSPHPLPFKNYTCEWQSKTYSHKVSPHFHHDSKQEIIKKQFPMVLQSAISVKIGTSQAPSFGPFFNILSKTQCYMPQINMNKVKTFWTWPKESTLAKKRIYCEHLNARPNKGLLKACHLRIFLNLVRWTRLSSKFSKAIIINYWPNYPYYICKHSIESRHHDIRMQ